MLLLLKIWQRIRAHAGSALCVLLLLLAMGGTWSVASPRAAASPGPVTSPGSKTPDASPTSSDSSGSRAGPTSATPPTGGPTSTTPSVATSSNASTPTTVSSSRSATATDAGSPTTTANAASSPTPTPAPSTGRKGGARKELAGKLNLNEATEQQLQLLPTVGPAKAERIVTWRKKNGGFHRLADLRRVKGFGYRTFKRLEPYLDIAGDTTLVVK